MTKLRQLAVSVVALALLAPPLIPGDWRCNESTCTAKIREGGVLVTETFVRGDVVSTEAGYVVNGDNGWVQVPPPPPPP